MDFLEFLIKIFLVVAIILLLLLPCLTSLDDRITSLEKLHNEYICLECNSLLQK